MRVATPFYRPYAEKKIARGRPQGAKGKATKADTSFERLCELLAKIKEGGVVSQKSLESAYAKYTKAEESAENNYHTSDDVTAYARQGIGQHTWQASKGIRQLSHPRPYRKPKAPYCAIVLEYKVSVTPNPTRW